MTLFVASYPPKSHGFSTKRAAEKLLFVYLMGKCTKNPGAAAFFGTLSIRK
jgi:hypothetical protein